PYALDLDLFGRASLFQFLGPAATPRGRLTLAQWMLRPAARAEILERQAAIAQLAAFETWRADLSAHGVLVSGAREQEIASFIEWAEGEEAFGDRAWLLRVAVLTLTAAIWVLIAADVLG